MSPSEQRIKLAEFMGWTPAKSTGVILDGWRDVYGQFFLARDLPNCPEDLNAVRSVEEKLSDEQLYRMNELLMELKPPRKEMKCPAEKWSWHASASQRCEAILRTIGEWTE